ncbi:MAG: TIGR03618 family F420-dependent PPOX class oxidoreductase [Actinobacteria bacterium]|nr:TIGR03618 family F420-dependent PPOX class oxidoreductase [Actinomycetota bacterium]
MELDDARAFIRDNHRAVLVTHRPDGRMQTSPVTVGMDGEGRAVVSSRETAYKTKNLKRDPRATLCVFNDHFFGAWIQIDGRADIASLPGVMDELVDYYRRISGEHPDWDEYRSAMEKDRRVLLRIELERAGPDREG